MKEEIFNFFINNVYFKTIISMLAGGLVTYIPSYLIEKGEKKRISAESNRESIDSFR